MFRKLTLSAAALALSASMAAAAGGEAHITDYAFSFEGPFGTYDQNQLQRGLQVYTEICSACHGLRYVPIRSLGDPDGPGLPDDQVRAYAEMIEIYDDELEDWRPARPNDHFPMSSLENAPDLSLMAKARLGFHGPYGTGLSALVNGIGGPEYIASLLTHYEEEPECALEGEPMDGYYNSAFPNGAVPETCLDAAGNSTIEGSYIAMAPPLWGDDVVYNDGAPTDLESVALDVTAFLMWTAEPEMMARKRMGLVAVGMLSILAVLLYLTNKRLWAPVKAQAKRRNETPAE